MSNNSPPERDVKEFEFIQLCKFRVSAPDQELPITRGKLLACSSHYGLVVYATKQGFSAISTAALLAIDEAKGKERSKVIIEDVPVLVNVSVSSPILFMDISYDGLFLAIAIRDQGQLSILYYDIRLFVDKGTSPAPFARSHVNASPSAVVCDLSWNPAVSAMLAVCTSDGNVELIDVTDTPRVIAVLIAATGATCFCWSPKGKQLLVGRKDGSLAQYDHALTEKKLWPCPGILAGQHTVVDVVWQSTYIFLAAYLPAQAQSSDQPVIIMSVSNKDNKTINLNFEDVCYGNGEDRKPQYFFHLVQKWDTILMASSNATETTIVGRNLDNKVSWERWNLEDCSRAELPLTAQQCDSFPMGLAVDYSPHRNIVINESKKLPPCPVMYLLSTDGLLVGYHLSYSHKDAAPTTTPAVQLLSAIGARKGIPELARGVSPSGGRGFLQASQPAAFTSTPSVQITAAPLTPASLGAPTFPPSPFAVKATLPSPVSTTTAGFPLTAPSALTPSQLPFSTFTTPSSTTTAPVFPFGGEGSKQPSPTSGPANQKQQTHIQTPPTSGFNQSGPSLFSFGNQATTTSGYSFGTMPTTTPSSAFANVSSSFSFSSAQSVPAKPFSQSQPPASFGSGSPTLNQAQTSGVAPTPSLFGHTQATLSANDDAGYKPGPHITAPVPKPSGIPGSAVQLRPIASSAFTSKPTSMNQGQTTLTTPMPGNGLVLDATQAHPTPGNGLVLGNIARKMSPVPQLPLAAQPTPFLPQPTTTPVMAPFSQPDSKFIEATVDSAFTQNILEEIMDFEKELGDLRARSRREVKAVGTREEMQSLRQDKEKMISFTAEISRVTKEQLSEVQEQKSMCFNLLAMSEQCQSKHKRDLDPHYHSLLMSRVLDPASAERLKALQQMSQSIEHSVMDVDNALDAQWQEHLTRKKKEERFHTPAGETIFKSIRNNHIVIASKKLQLEKLEEQFTSLRLYNKMPGRDYSSVSEVIGEQTPSPKSAQNLDLTMNSTVVNGMTPEKVAKLREILSKRKVPKVRSTAPANLSLSRIVHLTPGRSPAATSTPQAQLQQQTPQRPQQQRKHQLPQTVISPLSYQPGLTAGQHQVAFQRQPDKLQQGTNQTKPFTALDGAQRQVYSSPAPTQFSGVVHFKQQVEVGAGGKLSSLASVAASPAVVIRTGVGLAPAAAGGRPTLTSTPGVNLGSVGQVTTLSPLVGAATALPIFAMPLSSAIPTSSVPFSVAQQLNMYENITPTETEEDDDDYDEEDNGYEEEEEDEDEEETGFEGIPFAESQRAAKQFNQSLPSQSLAQVFGQQATRSLQPTSTFSPTARVIGASGAGASAVTSGSAITSSSGASIFKLPQNVAADADGQVFTSLKTTGQAPAVPVSSKPNLAAPPTTLSSSSLFGAKHTTGSVFGGSAVFEEPPGPQLSSSGQQGSVFGSQATPSRTVGFRELSDKSASSVGPDTLGDDTPSSTENKPFSSGLFSNSTTPTVSAVASVFGGKSPSEGSKFSFATTPTGLSSAGFGFSTSSASPAANTVPIFGTVVGTTVSAATTSTAANTPHHNQTVEAVVVRSAGADNAGQASPSSDTSSKIPLAKSSLWGVTTVQETNQDTNQDTTTSSSATSEAASTTTMFGTASNTTTLLGDTSKTVASPFFGGGSCTAATSSVFGGSPAKGLTPTPSLFGASSSTGTLFGIQATTTTAAAASPFGATSSIFGGCATLATPLFGSSSVTTTAASVFGTSTTSSSVFGGSGGGAPSSIFGGGTTTASSSSSPFSGAGPSVFGDTSTTKSASLFSSSTSSSVPTFGFGTAPASVFGAPTTTTGSSTGVFGGGSSGGLFGSSGTAAVSSAGPGLFGTGSSSPSAFSSTAPSQQGSIFGQTTAAAGFGFGHSSSAGGTSTVFGQSSAFGQQPASSSPGFGFGGLGGKPSEEKAKLNVFGSPQVFGSTSNQNNNLFGSGGTNNFGGVGSTSTFSANSGGFSAPAVGVGTSGFDVNNSQQTSGGFGAAPAFGNAPSFGGTSVFGNKSAGFGSSPSFGGSPSFGSTPSFASPTGAAPTFGSNQGGGFSSFASAAAPSFDQLAQSSPTASSFGVGGSNFGTPTRQPSPFGGGFGSPQSSFGGGALFGHGASSPGFGGGGAQTQGFGTSSSFGTNPAFSSYRG